MPRLAERLKDMQVPIRHSLGWGFRWSASGLFGFWLLVVGFFWQTRRVPGFGTWGLWLSLTMCNTRLCNGIKTDMKQLDWQSQLRSVAISDLWKTCLQFVIFAAEARKFAQVLQFTWPGCPLIYYGDELGLEGADDPHNRAPMPWGQVPWCFFLVCGRGKSLMGRCV